MIDLLIAIALLSGFLSQIWMPYVLGTKYFPIFRKK